MPVVKKKEHVLGGNTENHMGSIMTRKALDCVACKLKV
jgi:hypothetical protein